MAAKKRKLGEKLEVSKPRGHEWEIRDGRTVYIIHEKLAKKEGAAEPLMVLTRTTKFWRIKEAYKSIAAGLLTWALAGWLGMIIFHKTVVAPERAFQTLMPVFVGLFATSSIILSLVSKVKIPKQRVQDSYDVTGPQIAASGGSGFLGGIFAAFMPAITPGVGGVLSGNATGQRDDKVFIMSMGTNRIVYYVGAIAIFLLPLLHMRSGGMAINVNLFFIPQTVEQYLLVTAAIAICGFVSFLFLLYSSKLIARLISVISYQTLNIIALAVVVMIVFLMTGVMGLLIMMVATAIGIVPIMWNSRRLNLLGVILIPIWVNMAGLGPAVAAALGLG
jgi:putative membrane protein